MKLWTVLALVAAASCGTPSDKPESLDSQALPSGDTESEATAYLSARSAYVTALAEYQRGPAESRLLEMDSGSPDTAALARCEAAGEEYELASDLVDAAERMRSEARRLRYADPPRERLTAAEVAVSEAEEALGAAEHELRNAQVAIRQRAQRAEAEANLNAMRQKAQESWETLSRIHETQKRVQEQELGAAKNRLAEVERELETNLQSWRSSAAEAARVRLERARDGAKERVREAEEALRSVQSPPSPESFAYVKEARDRVAGLSGELPGQEVDIGGLEETADSTRILLLQRQAALLEAEQRWEAESTGIRERWKEITEHAEEAVEDATYRREVADVSLRRAILEAMEQRRPGGAMCSWRLQGSVSR